MLRPRERTRDLGPFTKQIKCCDYQPYLPNYRLGQLSLELSRPHSSANQNSEALLRFLTGAFLTPWGAWPKSNTVFENQRNIRFQDQTNTPKTALEQRKLSICSAGKTGHCSFVRQASDGTGAQCGIWEFRPAVCRSYFCIENKELGTFREQDLKAEAEMKTEWTKATECALATGFTFDDLNSVFTSQDEAIEVYEKCWLWLQRASSSHSK